MSTSFDTTYEAYPGYDYSISQLFYATKRKLQDVMAGGRIATTANQAEVNALEKEALEVLSLVRSVKNSYAPINRIPPEVLSLVPDYWDDWVNRDLIMLTHVCHGWRDMFISRSSLWTHLDLRNVDKTRTYIQRSRSSPLEVCLMDEHNTYLNDTFFLLAPHIHRIKSMVIYADVRPGAISALFEGDFSSLRRLRLCGTITQLPRKNLANLTTFHLKSCCPRHDFITRLLDFFENAPLLHQVTLEDSIPTSSDTPSGRIVPLPHLDLLAITSKQAHSTLLDHLCIPTGTSLILKFSFGGEQSPLRDYLPETSANLRNLSHITTLNLSFGSIRKRIRMKGPGGGLLAIADWRDSFDISSYTVDCWILRSIGPFALTTTHRLTVSKYEHAKPPRVERCPVFQTLSSMDDLRTLVLIECHNLPFILALNPEENPSKLVLCRNLEHLVLYFESQDQFHIKHLTGMARERASRDAKLSSITIIGLGELVPGKEVFKLREHIERVRYRVEDEPPDWDYLPGESSDEGE